jgi:hypothetical protein
MRRSSGLAVVAALALLTPATGPATAGNTEPGRASARATTTVDDRALSRSGTWKNKSFAAAFAGTLSKSKDKGARLTSAATTGGGKVVLQFGPGRGKVDVRVGGVKQKTIDTEAKTKKLKTVRFPGNGVVVLKVKKPGKGVYVDALRITTVTGTPAPGPGEVIFTEWLSNPDAITEANGEWFELQNLTAKALDLNGCTVTNQASASSTLSASHMLANNVFVFARNTNPADNGGLIVDGSFNAPLDTNGSLTLKCAGTTIDMVSWTGEISGQTKSLDPDHYTATDNNVAANYCPGTTPYGTAGDLGTPLEFNPQCP